ncbi:S4 domain-containing protein, partial [[Kitasatospora] papulosa]
MRSSGRNSGSGSGGNSGGGRSGGGRSGGPGSRNNSGTGRNSNPNPRVSGSGRDDKQEQRPRRPRPEERRYDVGSDKPGGDGGPRKGRGAAARGGAKGGPKPAQNVSKGGRRQGAPARPRELDAKIEQRNRDRYADKPEIRTPKTHPGAEQEGERLQKILARAGMGSRRACEELIEQARVEVNGEIVLEQGMRVDPQKDEIKVDGLTVATQSYLF